MKIECAPKEAEQDLLCINKEDYWKYLSHSLRMIQKMLEDFSDVTGGSERIELIKLTNWYMKELYELD